MKSDHNIKIDGGYCSNYYSVLEFLEENLINQPLTFVNISRKALYSASLALPVVECILYRNEKKFSNRQYPVFSSFLIYEIAKGL